MKPIIAITLLGSLAVTAATPAAPLRNAMRDAATHEQLVVKYRETSQKDPMLKMPPAKGGDPSIVNQPKDLISESDIICFNGLVTLVPKQAVLQIPKDLKDRLKYQPGAKLMSWADFYALNRGWITTVEVSRTQAEGNLPIADKTRKQMQKSGNLIVATYQAGPISVLPPKVPTDPAATTATANAKSNTPKP